jgi:hypothetical protein
MRRPILVIALLAAGLGSAASADEPAAVVAPSGSDVAMKEHPEEVASYTMRASLDPGAHTVHGEGTLVWKNVSSKPVNELWFHLYLNAFKNQSSVFMRAPVGGFRGTTVPKEWGTIDVRRLTLVRGEERAELTSALELRRQNDEDETDARLPLPKEIAPGESVSIEMVWDDKLPSVVERTGHDGSFHMVAQWFPKIAKIEADGTFAHFPFHHLGEFYADYGSYDVTLDVPQNFVIGATGPAVETKMENGRRIERHLQRDIHDFAWTAFDRWQEKAERIGDVDVRILFPKGYEGHANRELATMRFALPHFGARYGKYPYNVLTLVHPPATASEAGGMEYPTLITTGGDAWIPKGLHLPELVTIHEFGHQYFYGLLASHETKWPFLDEGLNSYAESEAMETWLGKGAAMEMFGIALGGAEAHAERARHFEHDDRVAQPAYAFSSGGAYGSNVYSRTATILETLRRVFGDAAMQKTMGTYARRYRFSHPTPDDLVLTFREQMGDRAADALRTALFDKGWVDFAVTGTSSHEAKAAAGLFDRDGKRETVPSDKVTAGKYEGWALVVRRGNLSVPVDIELVAEDGTRTRFPWDGKNENIRLPYSGASALRSVVVDPDNKVLLDDKPENNFATAWGRTAAGAPRTWERATFWAEVLLGATAP